MDDIKTLLGVNLRKIRESRDLTREELAEITGKSPNNIAKIENGGIFVSAEMLADLCDALQISPSDLFIDPRSKSPKSAARAKLNLLLKNLNEKKLKLVHDVAARILKDL